ncbi:MAG: Ku protein [Acidimicrobiales bacterium]
MPRAIWNGSISFGLVSIPVKLYSAVSRKTVRFNQIDAKTGARVKQKRVSAADGEEVPFERIVKGYELPSGDYVTISDDEVAALDPGSAHDRHRRVRRLGRHRPDLLRQRLSPRPRHADGQAVQAARQRHGGGGQGRHLPLRDAFEAVPRRGPARRRSAPAVDDGLRRRDRRPEEIGGFDLLDDIEIDEKEQAMAEQLIATLDASFDPARHRDTYREAVLELIERKAAGESGDDLVPAPAPSSDKVIDLMAALEASVKEAKKARGRHPASGRATKAKATKKAMRQGKATKAAKKAPRPQVGLRRWPTENGCTSRSTGTGSRSATSTRSCIRSSGSRKRRSSTTSSGSRRRCCRTSPTGGSPCGGGPTG